MRHAALLFGGRWLRVVVCSAEVTSVLRSGSCPSLRPRVLRSGVVSLQDEVLDANRGPRIHSLVEAHVPPIAPASNVGIRHRELINRANVPPVQNGPSPTTNVQAVLWDSCNTSSCVVKKLFLGILSPGHTKTCEAQNERSSLHSTFQHQDTQ